MHRLLPLVFVALLAAACGGEDSGRVAEAGDAVAVHYRGTLDDGSEFGSSEGGDPFAFTIGSGQAIPGFDEAVAGLAVGESRTVRIPAEEAYGERSDDLIVEVSLDQLPEGVAEGDELVSPQGSRVVVVEVGSETATIDTNHPLAGEALTFEITLVSIEG